MGGVLLQEFHISIRSFHQIRAFVSLAAVQPFDVFVGNDRQQVNGKSFMEMFCLNFRLPLTVRAECSEEDFSALLAEMNALETPEAKIYKALDKMEAVIQHNESDISTWLPLEYDLQLRYGVENMQFSPWFQALRQEIDQWTIRKIAESK